MALIRDLSYKGAWLVNANGDRIFELAAGTSALAPAERGIRTVLRDEDGNGGIPSGTPSERAELQRGPVGTYRQMQWLRWVEKFADGWPVGDTSEDWCYVLQWHLASGGTYAPLAFNVVGDRRQIRTNPNNGAWVPRWIGPLDRGKEVEWRVGVTWSTGSDGRLIAIRNGVKVVDYTGKTVPAGEVPYPKLGIYRNARKSGTMDVAIWGFRVFDADPGSFKPADGGTTTPPPPPPPPDPRDEQIAELNRRAANLEAQVATLTAARDAATGRAADLEAQLTEQTARAGALEQDVTRVTGELELARAGEQSAREQLDELGDLLPRLREDLTAARNRIATAERWKALTDRQRDSLGDVRRRLTRGLDRDGWPA